MSDEPKRSRRDHRGAPAATRIADLPVDRRLELGRFLADLELDRFLADPAAARAEWDARERREIATREAEHAAEDVVLGAILSRRRHWRWLLGKGYVNGPITERDLLRVGDCGQPAAFARLWDGVRSLSGLSQFS